MTRLPKVGDWIRRRSWEQGYSEVVSTDERHSGEIVIHVRRPSGQISRHYQDPSVTGTGDWLFRDKPKIIKSGFAAYMQRIDGSNNGDSK